MHLSSKHDIIRLICRLKDSVCSLLCGLHHSNCSQVKSRCRTLSVTHQAASHCIHVVTFEVFLMSTQKEFHLSVWSVIAAWRIVLCILLLWCLFFFCYKHMKKKPKMSDHPEWGICSVHYVKLGFSKHEELFPCSREALCSVDFSHCVMCSPSVNHPLSWRTANAWIFSTRAHVYSAFKGWMAIFSHSQVLLSVPLKLLDDYLKKFLNS